MEDTNIWYDAYIAYLRHQLERAAPPESLSVEPASWQPDLVLETVTRLWPPYAAPRWPHLIRGLEWACSEHEHRDEFAIALALAQRMALEYAEEQAALADWDCGPSEPYLDRHSAERQAEWERVHKFLYGDEDSSYFWDRFRWMNGG
ncbi:MAG: hypothetical protein U0822_15945 [Anaerolineae bacterium]